MDGVISEELIDYVIKHVLSKNISDEAILELGSGESTRRFVEYGKQVITVEHDPAWLQKVQGATYIYAPIKLYDTKYRPLPSIAKKIHTHTGWYDSMVLEEALRDKHYNLILVDGPPRNFGRSGFLQHLEIFPILSCPIVFDDLCRIDDLYVAERVASVLKRHLLVYNYNPDKPFGVVLP
jgi:hypothetical protein